MFERYSEDARKAIFFARYEASVFASPVITTEHLLLGLFRADPALPVREQIEKRTPPGRERVSTSVDLPLNEECKQVLRNAALQADRARHRIGIEHLLVGILDEKKSFSAQILNQHGVDHSRVREELARVVRTQEAQCAPRSTPVLEDIAPNLGARSGAGYFRKAATDWRKFHWEKRVCTPRDALLQRRYQRIFRYTGQPYDPAQFDFVEGGWIYDHCAVCWRELFQSGDPGHSVGYTNGQDWLCPKCYDTFVAPEANSS